MTPELKPCPFCGDSMERFGNVVIHNDGSACPIGVYSIDHNAWNRRSYLSALTPAEADGLVERLLREASLLTVNRSWDDTDDLLIEAATALASERAAHAETKRELDVARQALEPFSKYAGPLFERNFEDWDQVTIISAADGGYCTLHVRDFFIARRAREAQGGENG